MTLSAGVRRSTSTASAIDFWTAATSDSAVAAGWPGVPSGLAVRLLRIRQRLAARVGQQPIGGADDVLEVEAGEAAPPGFTQSWSDVSPLATAATSSLTCRNACAAGINTAGTPQ